MKLVWVHLASPVASLISFSRNPLTGSKRWSFLPAYVSNQRTMLSS